MSWYTVRNLETGIIEKASEGTTQLNNEFIATKYGTKSDSAEPTLPHDNLTSSAGFNPLKGQDVEAHFAFVLSTLRKIQKEKQED